MYLLPIHVPIYVDGEAKFVTTEWWRALQLLRDSFNGHFGDIVVAAPKLPVGVVEPDQNLATVPRDCGIELTESFDLRCRAREFWSRERPQWHRKLMALTARAEIVHAGLDDVYRPIAFEGFRVGLLLGKVTVFVQDTDIVLQQRQLNEHGRAAQRMRARAYGWIFERMCRWSVARADLSLLKGTALMSRYGAYARNAKEFHDTSFYARDIVQAERLERRLATLAASRALRLVYCGRLTERKGLKLSLEIVARTIGLGAQLQFDIIGSGPERASLEQMAASLGIADRVSFIGALPYDASLISRLGGYDGLLFTPTAEDTPRMIFDGYAAGLPVIASGIPYVEERHRQEHAAVVLPPGQVESSATAVAELCRNPQALIPLSRAARKAAEYHSAESWYARRAQWTMEAAERRQRQAVVPAAA